MVGGSVLCLASLAAHKLTRKRKLNRDSGLVQLKGQKPSDCDRRGSRVQAVKSELTEDEMDFILANTDFSRDYVSRWFEMFKAQCPDLKLDKARFVLFYGKFIGGEESESKGALAEAVFGAFDNNSNGHVDFGIRFLMCFEMALGLLCFKPLH